MVKLTVAEAVRAHHRLLRRLGNGGASSQPSCWMPAHRDADQREAAEREGHRLLRLHRRQMVGGGTVPCGDERAVLALLG